MGRSQIQHDISNAESGMNTKNSKPCIHQCIIIMYFVLIVCRMKIVFMLSVDGRSCKKYLFIESLIPAVSNMCLFVYKII